MRSRAVFLVAFVLIAACGGSSTGSFPFGPTSRAAPPFGFFDEARIAVGGRCLRVLVASTLDQRVQGLRDVRSLAPYDAMMFAFPSDTSARFTMAQTPLPLDIGWYASSGAPVDRATMQPCPFGTDESCPAYASHKKYRYALETAAGGLGSGALGACAA